MEVVVAVDENGLTELIIAGGLPREAPGRSGHDRVRRVAGGAAGGRRHRPVW